MRLDLSGDAERGLDGILAYSVKTWGLERGFAYVEAIRTEALHLAAGLAAGMQADATDPGLLRRKTGSHVLWFRIEGNALRVVRVLHQSQDPGRHLR